MSEQFHDGLTPFERSVAAERTLSEAILEALEARYDYDLAPTERGGKMADAEYALEEASEWIDLIIKRQMRAARESLWRSRILPGRERMRAERALARAAAENTDV